MSSAINTNVNSLIAQNALRQNNLALQTSLTRLSTGLKINSGADDPAGLIAANDIKDEQAGINQAIANAQRANNVIGTADGGLTEVSNLLIQLQSLVSQTASTGGLSDEEKSANQQQVDSILSTIDRVAGSTSFEGKQLLNGNYGYTTSSTAGTSAFASLNINSAQLADNKTTAVVVNVTASATAGQLVHTGAATLTSATTIQVGGGLGTQNLSFAAGTNLSAVAAAINTYKAVTGVSAVLSGTTTLKADATTFGSAQFVSIATTAGTFGITGGISKAYGTDAKVNVNGAAATVAGKNVTFNNGSIDLNFTLSTALNQNKTKTFGITGGGATFALGEKVTETSKAAIGIGSVSTGSLGDITDGFISSLASDGGANNLASGNLVTAQNIIDAAINQVSELSGRLGAFQKYTIGSTINNLSVAYENASSALSNIEDTDFAAETANLTRAQILAQSATSVLSTANSQPSQVLKLLS